METFTLSRKELHRPGLLKALCGGRLTNAQVAAALRITVRQVRRLKRRFEQGGPGALAHGNRGRASPRRILEQFMVFVRHRAGRLARAGDLTPETVQAWMDDMAGTGLALSTIRVRQCVVSSLCTWLAKRSVLTANPVAKLDRPPHRREVPRQG